jgi:hypothetical protein
VLFKLILYYFYCSNTLLNNSIIKSIILLLILFVWGLNTSAQKTYFTTAIDSTQLYDIIQTDNESYLLAGFNSSSTGSSLYPQNHLVKLNRKGNVLWQKAVSDSFDMETYAAISSQKSIIWGSWTTCMDGVFMANTSGWIIIDEEGNSVCQKRYRSANSSYKMLTVCIEKNSMIDIIRTDSLYNIVFERIDTNGNIVHSSIVPQIRAQQTHLLTSTSNNAFVFITQDTSALSSYMGKFFISCIDSMGNMLWNKPLNIDSLGNTSIYSILLLNNHIYSLVYNWSNQHKVYVYKTDLNGNTVAQKELVTADLWFGAYNKISTTAKGALYFYTNYNNNLFVGSQLFKVDENLNIKWSIKFPNQFLQSIGDGYCNSIICSFDNFPNTIIKSIKDTDLPEVCDVCETTVFPNPISTNEFNIKSNSENNFITHIEIWDYTGRKVWEGANSTDNSILSIINQLSSGIYVCKNTCNNGQSDTKRIVIGK